MSTRKAKPKGIVRAFLKREKGENPEAVIEHLCDCLIQRLGKSEPPFQTEDYEFARLLGLTVLENEIFPAGMLSFFDGRFLIEVKEDDSPERKSFTVCHEIGHLEMRRRGAAFSPGDRGCIVLDEETTRDEERLADLFAVNLLMPRKTFQSEVEKWSPGIDSLVQIARRFKTSLDATARRVTELGFLNALIVWGKPEKMRNGWWAVEVLKWMSSPSIKLGPSKGGKYVKWACEQFHAAYFGNSVVIGETVIEGAGKWKVGARGFGRGEDRNVTAVLIPIAKQRE